MSAGFANSSRNRHSRRLIRSSSTSTRLYRSFSTPLASASSPTCHTHLSSSMRRSGTMRTSTARKCAIHRSSTRHSASSAGLSAIQADREVVPLVAVPVVRGVLAREHVEVDRCAWAPIGCAAARQGFRSRRSSRRPRQSRRRRPSPRRRPSSAIFCVRNSISAARASTGSASSPRTWRSRICVSCCTNSGGTSTPSPRNSATYAASSDAAVTSRSRKRSQTR